MRSPPLVASLANEAKADVEHFFSVSAVGVLDNPSGLETRWRMTLDSLVSLATERGASDLHLEPGLPPAIRIRGALKTMGEPLSAKVLLGLAKEVIGDADWPQFEERWSSDVSQGFSGVRCRINLLRTSWLPCCRK